MSAPLSTALELAAGGLACFPVASNKHPTTKNGFYAASTEPGVLCDLWEQHPGPLVGVATGSVSGIDVLDIDNKPSGREWWARHRAQLPRTRVHRSRSGGLHLLFQHAPGLRISAGKIEPGIDVRADGGYIIWWPGVGKPVLCDASSAPWPAWLLERLRSKPPPPCHAAVLPDDLQIRRILACISGAREGERNSLTYWAACRLGEMVASGFLSESDALDHVVEAATANGLPFREALATARSGIGGGC